MSEPEVVFIDKRVARQMDQEGGGDLVGYVRQDIHEAAVRSAGTRARETVVQIHTNPDGRLIGLSSRNVVGRKMSPCFPGGPPSSRMSKASISTPFVSETKEDLPNWIPVTDFLPEPDLDS